MKFFSLIFLNIIFFIFFRIGIKGYVGPAGDWCWIRTEGIDPETRDLLRFLTFYFFIWLGVACNISIAIYLRFFNKNEINPEISDYVKKKLILIPILMSLCWIIPSIDRIANYYDVYNEVLSMFHLISTGLTGFFNSLVYALSPGTWELFKKRCWLLKEGLLGMCFERKKSGEEKELFIENKEVFLSTNPTY